MAKNNKTKIWELRNAVLSGSVEQVEDLFAKDGPFTYTAEALGLAVRYCGVPMVRTLLDHGATFEYTPTSTLRKNTDERTGLADRGYVDFRACLFPALDPSVRESSRSHRRGYSSSLEPRVLHSVLAVPSKPTISAEERLEVMKLITERNLPGLHGFLYFAILANDTEIYDYLIQHKVIAFPAPYPALLGGLIPMTEFVSLRMYAAQDLLARTLRTYRNDTLLQVLGRFKEAIPGPLGIFKYDTLSLERVSGDPDLFIFCADHTDMKEEFGCMDVMKALIACKNARGFAHILDARWLNLTQMQNLLDTLRKKEDGTAAELSTMLLTSIDKRSKTKKSLQSLSLNPRSGMEAVRYMWSFRNREDGVEIYSYKGPGEDAAPISDLVVPDKIGKKPVVAITSKAFQVEYYQPDGRVKDARRNLTSIQFPGSILKLHPSDIEKQPYSHGFRFASSVQRIVVCEGTQSIGDSAFAGCDDIVVVELPSTLRTIGKRAFRGCASLKRIRFPEGLREIGENAFACAGLTEVICPPGLRAIGDNAFNTDEFRFYQRQIGRAETVQLNEGLERIGSGAFCGSHIRQLVIPASVCEISNCAFDECEFLETVEFLGADTRVAPSVFRHCAHLSRIIIPEGARELDDAAFGYEGRPAGLVFEFKGRSPVSL